MLFNSLHFALFLPIVFALYWVFKAKNVGIQNGIILLASLTFYLNWNWHFTAILVGSILLNFVAGLKISTAEVPKTKKIWTWLAISINLGILVVFKYFDFFIHSLKQLFGDASNHSVLYFILPIGLSFYTFRNLAYIIDVSRAKISPEKNIVNYGVFVSFFPSLLAGPIEKAEQMLPQIRSGRSFDYSKAVDGLKQILWGLFKKLVIADNCASIANDVFTHAHTLEGNTLLFGVVVFSIQLYADISGYSDIAIGTARLFGFEFSKNFNSPFLSVSFTDFWRRWHISFSSWFTDYLLAPLTNKWSKWGKKGIVMAILLTFLLIGIWHGPTLNFLIFGLIHGLILSYEYLTSNFRKKIFRYLPNFFKFFIPALLTYLLILIGWIFFRSEDFSQAADYFIRLFTTFKFKVPVLADMRMVAMTSFLFLFYLFIEWSGRKNSNTLSGLYADYPKVFRWSFYSLLIFLIGMYMNPSEVPFVYFKF